MIVTDKAAITEDSQRFSERKINSMGIDTEALTQGPGLLPN